MSGIGLIEFTIISLYQLGIIKSLPDFPGKNFDSDQVNITAKAFALGFPDGPLSTLIYSFLLLLIGYKGDKKSGRPDWADWLIGGFISVHAIGAADYLKDMIRQKKICIYCLTGALINFISLPIMIKLLMTREQ